MYKLSNKNIKYILSTEGNFIPSSQDQVHTCMILVSSYRNLIRNPAVEVEADKNYIIMNNTYSIKKKVKNVRLTLLNSTKYYYSYRRTDDTSNQDVILP